MTRTRRLVVALALVALGACAYQGAKFDFQKMDLLRQGVTTQDEVFRMFGRPLEVRQVRTTDGLFLSWLYRYLPIKGDGAILEVLFDDRGIVHHFHYKLVHDE